MTQKGKSVTALLCKVFLLCTPLLVALVVYVVYDPFWVLRPHTFGNYYDDAAPVDLNRDYASLRIFEQNHPREQFDSFILGSSRSFPIHCPTWSRYLSGGRPFHYPAASENIHGILAKLQYLDARGVQLKHVLFEVTSSALAGATPRHDHLHRLPRELTGESAVAFQSAFLKAYFTNFFWIKYLDYRVTGRVKPYASDVLGIARGDHQIDPLNNDYFFAREERELAADPEGYYQRRSAMFAPPTGPAEPPCAEPVIGEAQRKVLLGMQAIFRKHGTDARIIISPSYTQVCLNRADLAELRRIFGDDAVHDFTGGNPITRDMRNFYDPEHVRPAVAERMLETIYAGSETSGVGRHGTMP
jgi:hypothetical protein